MAKRTRRPSTAMGEEDWAAIQQKAILVAEAVKCPLEQFLEGLKVMQFELQDRILLVESEIEQNLRLEEGEINQG